ncbi:MAG: transposase [Ignavibacteriaceae bacterium]|nr:transposase [Ignavibacteriaceae bacterium]
MKKDSDFTPEEKAAIIKEYLKEGADENVISAKYDIPVSLLWEWEEIIIAGITDKEDERKALRSKAEIERLKAEAQRLQKVINELRRENRVLKRTPGMEFMEEKILRKPGK